MKEYKILITDKPDFRKIKKAPVDCYEWGGEYRPKTYAQLAFIPKKGFIARLTAYESEPKAVYKNNMDPVYTDSCLEFFARYKKGGYVNCEVNANGAILSAYGEGRGNRTPLDKLAGEFPKVRIFCGNCYFRCFLAAFLKYFIDAFREQIVGVGTLSGIDLAVHDYIVVLSQY